MGMRIINESTYWWVWSKFGPSDEGINFHRTFVNGMLPCPVPGDIAQEMEGYSYVITQWVPGTWFHHWEQEPEDSSRWFPVFAPWEFKQPKKKRGRPPKVKPESVSIGS